MIGDDKMEKRTIRLEVTLNATEHEQLRERMAAAHVKTASNFLRIMALKGYVINIDLRTMLEPVKLMRNISSNINQISMRVNSTNNIYADDITELKEYYSQLSENVSKIVGYISQIAEE